MHQLTKEQARRIALRAQLLAAERPSDLVGTVERLTMLQLDTAADRKASVLRVNAIHADVDFTRPMKQAVDHELSELAAWLELRTVERP